MSSLFGFFKRVYTAFNPPAAPVSTESTPIRFGILGAANIAPPALIGPAKNHSEATVYAVAARDLGKAQAFAKKYGIEKTYGGLNAYEELLNDPNIDAVYNPLPNGLHFEWTMKALAAGKHVLLEKPSADTSEETKKMFEFAREKGLILLEAFHYRFHPAVHRTKQILESGEIGAIKSVEVSLAVPKGIVKSDDIRFNYQLGGGSLMDMGCYTLNCARFLTSSEPTSVISTSTIPLSSDPKVDVGTTATLAFPSDVTATIICNLALAPTLGFIPQKPKVWAKVVGENGELTLYQFVLPTLYHYIEVSTRSGRGGKGMNKRTEKVYSPRDIKDSDKEWKGEDWWTTYRYQLEAFIDKLKGRTPAAWVSAEDSIANLKAIEMVYKKAGLPLRPASEFKLPDA